MDRGKCMLTPTNRNKQRILKGTLHDGRRVTLAIEWDVLVVLKAEHGL